MSKVLLNLRMLLVFAAGLGTMSLWITTNEYINEVSLPGTYFGELPNIPSVEIPGMGKLSFSDIGKWPTHSIEIDESTVSKMVDEDGDTLVGAMFRLTFLEPIVVGDKRATFMINGVVATCGYDAVLLISSRAYSVEGELITEASAPMPFADQKIESTPTTEMYKKLCTDVPPNKERGYNSDHGNNFT